MLTSSREPLDVDGETTFPVRPLPVTRPEGTGEEPLPFGMTDFQAGGEPGGGAEAATAGDAVELFARRAAAVVPGFTLTDANRADVIRLCQRLDGIPLAIELAAVRLRTLSLAELAARLDHRLPLLTGGNSVSDGRHRTLRDAIGWSYELCTDAERALWARLSVFAGAFNVAAAREVCASAGLDEDDILETIIRLVDKSVLVRVQPTTVGVLDEDQPAWYRMLDTIHEFGGEMLSASGDEDAVRDRFIGRYLAKAQYFAEHLTDEVQLERFRELRREHSNLRAALQYTLDDERRERIRQGAELANALYGYWHMSGLLREGRYWYRKVLDTLPDASTPERGWALASRGYLGAMQGEAAEAVADASAGTQIGHELGDDRLIGRGYNYLTLALTIAARYDEARVAAAKAESKLEALGDRTGLAILDCHWAHLSHLSGDPAERRSATPSGPWAGSAAPGSGGPPPGATRSPAWRCTGSLAVTRRPPACSTSRCCSSTNSATWWGRPTAWRSTAGWPPGSAATCGPPGCSARRTRCGSWPAAALGVPRPSCRSTSSRSRTAAWRLASGASTRCSPAAALRRTTTWSRSRSPAPRHRASGSPPSRSRAS